VCIPAVMLHIAPTFDVLKCTSELRKIIGKRFGWRVAAGWNISRTTIAVDCDMLIKISRMRPATTTPFVRRYHQLKTSIVSYIYGWVGENPWPNSAIVELPQVSERV
jgi:hypothetical protein